MMKYLLLCLAVAFSLTAIGQHNHDHDHQHHSEEFQKKHRVVTEIPPSNQFYRCATTEYEAYLRDLNKIQTVATFENWMAKHVEAYAKRDGDTKSDEVFIIPTIIHVVHHPQDLSPAEGSTNILKKYVDSQIEQMNDDFRQLGLGESDNEFAADVHIEFRPALYDPEGNELAEPGVNRINPATHNPPLGVGVYSIAEFDDVVKSNTIWDPERFFNFWSADLGGGVILGYAQFPEAPCLEGVGTGNGSADHDGVVCLYSTVGGEDAPAPNAPYDLGRTGTHEVGHWLGLRHIWGDGDCGADDFVADTPNAADSNGGCPETFPNSCDDSSNPVFGGADPVDQQNNYMDYSADQCFDMFSNLQRTRMRIVMGDTDLLDNGCAGSPRRESLRNSTEHLPAAPTIAFNTPESSLTELTDCNAPTAQTIELRIAQAATQDATVTIEATGGTATEGIDFTIVNPTVTFAAGTADNQTVTINVISDGATEDTETIELTITTIENNGGDAAISNVNTHKITINDDDVAPLVAASDNIQKLEDNFDDGDMEGWSTTAGTREEVGGQLIPAGNFWTVNTNADVASGSMTAYITVPDALSLDLHTYDSNTETRNVLFTRIDATGLSNIKLDFDYICVGEPDPANLDMPFDFGTIVAAAVVPGATEQPAFVRIQNAPLLFNQATTSSISFTLPESFNGKTFDLGFEWYNDTNAGGTPPLSVDNIVVTADQKAATPIETVVETDSKLVYQGQTVHFYGAANNIIATIENASADLGCVEVKVLSDGGAANIDLASHTASGEAASKTYEVIPSMNPNASYTMKMYYTDAELSTWSTNAGVAETEFNVFRTDAATVGAAILGNTESYSVQPTTYMDVNGAAGKIFTTGFTGFGKYGGANVAASGNNSLSADLLAFNGVANNNQVFLNWEVANELDVAYYEVERAIDRNNNFSELTKVNAEAKAGEGATYQSVDAKPAVGNNYYRLRIVDTNGEFRYSNTIVVNFTDPSFVTNIFPNPAKDVVFVNLNNQASDVKIMVRNYLGQVVETSFVNNGTTLEINTARLSAGTYFLEIDSNLGRELKRVVINK